MASPVKAKFCHSEALPRGLRKFAQDDNIITVIATRKVSIKDGVKSS